MPPPLTDRALGWLRFMWDKATTDDDWTDQGEPHAWWDRYTEPPMCTFPRFDLAEMAYTLPLMAQSTPAWREGYVRIVDELLRRYTTFWGAIDWNSLVGPDPNVDRYPPEWLIVAPERLRGRYALPGWTANGVEPWGLQPDPVGCDGNLFYRGWLNLLLGIRQYLSGQENSQPFDVVGYRNRTFSWSHGRVARFISHQMAARPQGPHCENTKIWPFCISAAGLGLTLYDSLNGTSLKEPFHEWISFAERHYMGRDRRGKLDWVALYYDPIEGEALILPGQTSAYAAIPLLHYLYPVSTALSIELYEMSMHMLAWNDPKVPVRQLSDDPQMIASALWMAREIGDTLVERRLRDVVESRWHPRFFGHDQARFGYFVDPAEPWPRGQINATVLMAECANAGAWSSIFTAPDTAMHHQPTVRDVDYPAFGIRYARNNMDDAVLTIDTFAATPSRRGENTTITIDQLPATIAPDVRVDGAESTRWRRTGPTTVILELDIADHHIEVSFAAPA